MMRILVHDFGGYAFPFELSRELACRGYTVRHAYCASLTTTPLGVDDAGLIPEGLLSLKKLTLRKPLSKYNLLQRWWQENAYGRLIADEVREFEPDVVISANTPLDAQRQLINTCRDTNTHFIFWLQDLLGVAANFILRQKLLWFGGIIGTYYKQLERTLLSQSDAIVAVSEDYLPFLRSLDVDESRLYVIRNWAPVERIPARPKRNAWSIRNGLSDVFCFMYSGTLGMKHNPELLLSLARSINHRADVRVVVISQGIGAAWLKQKKQEYGLQNLIVLPYENSGEMPEVLASADVLIALLEPVAGLFSVPSKVLTYLCVQRPLLLAVPEDNLAARIVESCDAGIVVSPEDPAQLIREAEKLLNDECGRSRLADNARQYAEAHFSSQSIVDRFEKLIYAVKGTGPVVVDEP